MSPRKFPATADLTLRPTTDLAAQLTNAEWFASLPGDLAQKQFLQNCVGCHSLQRPLYSTHTAEEFTAVQERMAGYAAASSVLMPQRLLADRVTNQGEFALEKRRSVIQQQAAYLAGVNLSKGTGVEFPVADVPPSNRTCDACRHHRIRSARANAHAA